MKFTFLIILINIFSLGCASLGARGRNPAQMSDFEDFESDYGAAAAESGFASLRLGMEMQDVLTLWGEPRDVKTAGNPDLGNQKWVYYSGLSNSAWRLSSPRIVYFENGRVVGWDTSSDD